MASRGAFGFRSARQPEKEDKKTRPGLGLSRTSSITSSAPSAPKLPTHSTSFFSRSKTTRARPELPSKPTPNPNTPTGRGQNPIHISSTRSETGRLPGMESTTSLDGGSASGLTTVTVKAGKPRNVLRRKAPSIEPRIAYAGTESSASSHEPIPSRRYLESRSSPGGYTDSESRSIFGVTAPQPTTSASYTPSGLGLGSEYATSSSHMATYNNRQNLQSSSTPTLPPPTPNYVQDSSSSTRRSESPGAFSQTSTHTSMSSQSPGVATPAKVPSRTRTASPTKGSRPPVTLRRNHERLYDHEAPGLSQHAGLPSVRESATSSSSSSTIKPESRTASRATKSERPSTPPSSLPPTASQGFPQRSGSLKYRSERSIPSTETTSDVSSRQRAPGRLQTPPIRPSREGVPELDPSLSASSEQTRRLQPSAPIYEGRVRGSLDNDRSQQEDRTGDIRPIRAATGYSPSTSSSAFPFRMPSPSLGAVRSSQTQTSSGRSRPSPSLETNLGSTRFTKDPSPQSAGSSKSSSRFGFFTRRTKSPIEAPTAEKAEKSAKKGPAAGTGHEGYGKYARRGRSGSTATSSSRGRSTSSTSIGRTPSSRKSSLTSRDEPVIDDFFRERLAPKPIVGGGRPAESSSGLFVSSSAQSSSGTLDSNARSVPNLQARIPQTETTTGPAQKLHHVNRRLPQREEGPEKAGSAQPYQQIDAPTLATRRSLHRSQILQSAEPVRIPAPIDTDAVAPSAMNSKDTYQSSIPQTDTTVPLTDDISEGHEGDWLKSSSQAKTKKSPRKWNFFQRSQAPSKRPPVPATPRSDDDQNLMRGRPANVLKAPESRTVPFYAVMDSSEQESVGQASMSQLTRSNSQVDRRFGSFSTNRSRDTSPDKQQYKMSMLLPSPPTLATEFPQPATVASPIEQLALAPAKSTEEPEPITTQVPRKPRLQQVGRIPRVVSKRDREHRPPPQSFSRPRPYTPKQDDTPSSAPVMSEEVIGEGERPALGFQTEYIPQRPWDSQDSGKPASAPAWAREVAEQGNNKDEFLAFPSRMGSSVSGSSSSGILALAATTAVVPEPGMAPAEDEVWNEYNEFLDTVTVSPAPVKNEKAEPLDKQKTRIQPAPLHIRKGSSLAGSKSGSPEHRQAATYPPAAAAPNRDLPSPPKKSKFMDVPPTPGTLTDLIAGYVDRDSGVSKHRSRSTSSRYSTSSIESEVDSLAGHEARGLPNNSPKLTPAQRLSQIYLRRDALLASRWLSFDRILFSPVHFEVQHNHTDNVLVLDGLGNDEWSFYCAENYPNATIYNLSPFARTDAPAVDIPGVPKPPQNHQHIYHSSLGRPFPFPQGFFTAAVFRFPAITSDAAYYNAISEFKRVLRPGGYLEMSMLDIDMVNMGNLTRRALRGIKERRQLIDSEVSLKPLSDNIQKMLGKKAFENLNRCTLDVPVAGHVSNSRSESFDEASGKELPRSRCERASANVAKNLAKVGRWWFSSCYETGSGRSIWEDRTLLAECEARETGFKLLLCYAQKPVNKRRTRSF